MDRAELKKLITNLINQKCEGEYWDFKLKWHDNMDDLIKDIFCFTNTAHFNDCYLIFGVNDNYDVIGVKEERKTLASINDKLQSLEYGSVDIPIVELESIDIDNKIIDILIVKNCDNTPVYLNRTNGKMLKGCIYTREGDKNTPNSGNALISQIEVLWKKRLGLNKSKLEFIKEHLLKKEEWIQSSDESNYKYFDYNIYLPEYIIEEVQEDSKFSKSWFSYMECNSNEYRNVVQIKYNNTVLYGCGITTLDGGRYTTTYPDECLAGKMLDKIGYEICFNYYIKGTMKYCLHKYYLNKLSYCYESSYNDFIKNILIFENRYEFESFHLWVKNNVETIREKMSTIQKIYHLQVDKNEYTEYVENCIKCSQVLQSELNIFRKEQVKHLES